MIQAVTTAKKCEANKIAATQAAKEATISYNMTQRSVKELSRLVKQSNETRKPTGLRSIYASGRRQAER